MPDIEQPLAGGNLTVGVVRVGDTVRRQAGPWTPAVHALLTHLFQHGYPAPRPLGFDEHGREVLSYVTGEAVHPDHYELVADDASLRYVGSLISAYHEVQSKFAPPADAQWRDEGRDPSGSQEVLAHNDLAPWNLIAGPQWTFIDWDLVAPGRRDWDLALALHTFVGLWPGSEHPPRATARRINAFCDGAAVPASRRQPLLHVVVARTQHNADLIVRRAALGETTFQRLLGEGHAESWSQGSAWVADNIDLWGQFMAEG